MAKAAELTGSDWSDDDRRARAAATTRPDPARHAVDLPRAGRAGRGAKRRARLPRGGRLGAAALLAVVTTAVLGQDDPPPPAEPASDRRDRRRPPPDKPAKKKAAKKKAEAERSDRAPMPSTADAGAESPPERRPSAGGGTRAPQPRTQTPDAQAEPQARRQGPTPADPSRPRSSRSRRSSRSPHLPPTRRPRAPPTSRSATASSRTESAARRRRRREDLRPGQRCGPGRNGRRTITGALVVVLVRLVDAVARVDGVHVGEAAAQAGHVDPLLGVGRRVDVGPADRGAERDLARLPAYCVARRVDARCAASAACRAACGARSRRQ